MNEEKLVDELNKKVSKEYNKYLKNLRKEAADVIIANSEKTVLMRKFFYILTRHAGERLECYEIEKLLKVENILETLYADWLRFDDEEFNDIEEQREIAFYEFVFGYWDWEALK